MIYYLISAGVYAIAVFFAYGAAFSRLYAHPGGSDSCDDSVIATEAALCALAPFPTILLALKTGFRWRRFPECNVISCEDVSVGEIRQWVAEAEVREYFIRRHYRGVVRAGFAEARDAIAFKLRFK